VDFLIDGESLLQALVKMAGGHGDFMGCFADGFTGRNIETFSRLMLKADPDTQRGGVLLYICPECLDIGCGAYSVRVERTDIGYAWDAFAHENGYEEPQIVEGIGPFLFAHEQYETALERVISVFGGAEELESDHWGEELDWSPDDFVPRARHPGRIGLCLRRRRRD
jgi:hypothetical protein